MSFVSDFKERARALLFRDRAEADMDAELRFHIEREVEERVRHGANPGTARREALIALGGVERRKEEVRDARGVRPLENFAADLRHGARALRRDPVFSIGAVLVLALGIGAASAVFGIADAVLLRALPYPEPDRIVRIYQNADANRFGLSVVDAQAIAEQQRSFEAFGVMRGGGGAVSTGGGRPEQRSFGRVTSGFFKALAVKPAIGRLIEPSDEMLSAPPVVVLFDALAARWFGSAQAAMGKILSVDGVSHTIIGVMPPDVVDLAGMRLPLWLPMQMTPPTRKGPFGIRGFARMRRGVTFDAATRDLAGVSERIFPIWKSSYRDSTTKLAPIPLREAILGDAAARQVGLLGAGVALVLLVAIANVAMLMLVRVSARESELAVRSALGAGRWRLARLIAAESLVLGVIAAILGFALASLLLNLAPNLMPNLPRIRDVASNARVAGMAALAALLAAALASISPILSVLARSANASITADRRVGSDRQSNSVRSLLVAAEFGLALPLLFGAGLLLNSFLRLQRVNPGYDPDGAVGVSIGLPQSHYPKPEDGARFWRELEQRVHDSPAFAGAGLSTSVPPDNGGDINNFDLKDRPVAPGGAEHLAPWTVASNGYFEALKIPLLEGRLFSPADTNNAPPVVIVSRAWARKYYPGESAIGRQLISGGCTTCPLTTVIGVVGDVKYLGLAESSDAVYDPMTQNTITSTNLVARIRGGAIPAAAFTTIRNIVSTLDPELAVVETTLRDEIDASLADPKRWTSILGAFSLATVTLATVGIFGLLAYTVRQRRREIGVRMALGARPSAVVWMIVARGMRYAVAGSVAGILIALWGARWIRSFLFDVGAGDPLTLIGVTFVLLSTAAVACWLAGRRAADIDPVEAIASN